MQKQKFSTSKFITKFENEERYKISVFFTSEFALSDYITTENFIKIE